ncbi:MAG TPA: hypothetical protein VIC85_04945 [Ktedonobacterales bacterium]|jgi:hypothetical protein
MVHDDHTGLADQPDDPDTTLAALLRDLTELRDYLAGRGHHTYELAQRFMQNARRGGAESAYDERQATMLEYQHYIWHEIAGRVDQLLARYGAADDGAGTAGDETATDRSGVTGHAGKDGQDGREQA